MGMAMAVECDLRGCMLGFLIAVNVEPEEAKGFLQSFANAQAAWNAIIADMGISAEAMKKAGPPESPFLEFLDELLPEPEVAEVAELKENFQGIIAFN